MKKQREWRHGILYLRRQSENSISSGTAKKQTPIHRWYDVQVEIAEVLKILMELLDRRVDVVDGHRSFGVADDLASMELRGPES